MERVGQIGSEWEGLIKVFIIGYFCFCVTQVIFIYFFLNRIFIHFLLPIVIATEEGKKASNVVALEP